jgi:hypothetical protein
MIDALPTSGWLARPPIHDQEERARAISRRILAASAVANAIVFADTAVAADEFRWIKMLTLDLHDHSMQEAVPEHGVAGNFKRHLFEKSAAGFDIERHCRRPDGGHLFVG